MALKLIDGESLKDMILKHQLSNVEFLKIVNKVIVLVWQLHDKGYVHGDLKPENILVESKTV